MAIIVALQLGFAISATYGQPNKKQLEQERRQNLKRIAETSKILNETRSERKATVGALNAIRDQVNTRGNIISGIHQELDLLQEEILKLNTLNESMSEDLQALKDEYTAMIYAASKADVYNRLMFIFSSKTFNQFVMRLKYLQQYAEARHEQVDVIVKVQKSLLAQQMKLIEKTREKEKLLFEQLSENDQLTALKDKQQKVVKDLSRRERELRIELTEQLEADHRLEKMMSDLVRREIKKSLKEAKAARVSKNEPEPEEKNEDANRISLTPEAAIVSNNFSENKGRLLWPVEAGFIAGEFGKQKHPVLEHVIIDNLGINIQTNQNEQVRAVFDGEVGFVGSVGGIGGNIVSLTHGDYFTVYCNLRNVKVKRGQHIKAKEKLGEVFTDKDGVSGMQFQIWKNTERLNPAYWLQRK